MELGFVVAERVLYVPSAGFCLLIAMVVQHMLGESGTVEPESTEASLKGGKSGAKKGESEKSVSEAASSTRTMPTIGRLAVVVILYDDGRLRRTMHSCTTCLPKKRTVLFAAMECIILPV